jgi:hypothetical protein
MRPLLFAFLSILLVFPLPVRAGPGEVSDPIAHALDRMYNFDFPGAHKVLDEFITEHPEDPLGYTFRGAAYLFYELDRLRILDSEFFADDNRIAEKKKLNPDPEIRNAFFKTLERAQGLGEAKLKSDPGNHNALFALCLRDGLIADYTALVEKKQLRSLGPSRRSNRYAIRLLKIAPSFYDAYLAPGVNEYLLGSLPFFLRWFIHMNQIEGSKERAIHNLQLVAKKGKYLGPFARILLAIIYLREKAPEKTRALLQRLTDEYPQNRLMRKELAKVTEKLKNGEPAQQEAR